MNQDETVFEVWGMCCPRCGIDDAIDVAVEAWSRLIPDGSDLNESEDQSQRWDADSVAVCAHCRHSATVRDFSTEEMIQ